MKKGSKRCFSSTPYLLISEFTKSYVFVCVRAHVTTLNYMASKMWILKKLNVILHQHVATSYWPFDCTKLYNSRRSCADRNEQYKVEVELTVCQRVTGTASAVSTLYSKVYDSINFITALINTETSLRMWKQ